MRQIRFSDLLATLFAVAAAGLYVVWASDLGFTDMSTRDVAATIFVLGFAGCVTDQTRMADVYGAGGHPRAPMWFAIAGSAIGGVALVAGILAIILADKVLIGVTTAAIVLLWSLATGRHVRRIKPQSSQPRELRPIH